VTVERNEKPQSPWRRAAPTSDSAVARLASLARENGVVPTHPKTPITDDEDCAFAAKVSEQFLLRKLA